MRKKLHTFLLYLIMAALVIGKNYGMFMHIFNDALQFATVKEILKQNRFFINQKANYWLRIFTRILCVVVLVTDMLILQFLYWTISLLNDQSIEWTDQLKNKLGMQKEKVRCKVKNLCLYFRIEYNLAWKWNFERIYGEPSSASINCNFQQR